VQGLLYPAVAAVGRLRRQVTGKSLNINPSASARHLKPIAVSDFNQRWIECIHRVTTMVGKKGSKADDRVKEL